MKISRLSTLFWMVGFAGVGSLSLASVAPVASAASRSSFAAAAHVESDRAADDQAWIGEIPAVESLPLDPFVFSGLELMRGVQHSVPLMHLTNDRGAAFSDLDFVIDANGNVSGLTYVTHDVSGQISQKAFQTAQLGTADGAVLEQERGVKAIAVMGALDEARGTGSMRFRFIGNGLTGQYKTCDVSLARSGTQGAWQMRQAQSGQPVMNVKIISWSLGITTLQGLCP